MELLECIMNIICGLFEHCCEANLTWAVELYVGTSVGVETMLHVPSAEWTDVHTHSRHTQSREGLLEVTVALSRELGAMYSGFKIKTQRLRLHGFLVFLSISSITCFRLGINVILRLSVFVGWMKIPGILRETPTYCQLDDVVMFIHFYLSLYLQQQRRIAGWRGGFSVVNLL